jgi:hypothetical protein
VGLKEAIRAIYRAADRADAERRLELFLAGVDRAAIPSFTAFAKDCAHGARSYARTSTSRPATATPRG